MAPESNLMKMTESIQMVDLKRQYAQIQEEIDTAILDVVRSTRYIKGPEVDAFEQELATYLGVKHVIACANGTDALQIALMSLGLKPGDEVIVPSFTFVATAEVIGLLQLIPVMVDVDPHTFNVRPEDIKNAITNKTRAIVPVHLYGQTAPMEEIKSIADEHGIPIIEDNAQAIGSDFIFSNGHKVKSGTIGNIGCTSFFPSKNLGCYGDGGALFTDDDTLADTIKMIANHGQSRQYYHDRLGVNSRLDALQAVILRIKLRHLDSYCDARRTAATYYDQKFAGIDEVQTPYRAPYGTHVFHQYTMKVPARDRDPLKHHLAQKGIPSMVYYPVPLYKQKAFTPYWPDPGKVLEHTEDLCGKVISLPMHTELDETVLDYISAGVQTYFS